MKTQNNVNFTAIVARFTTLLTVVSTLMNFKLKETFKTEILEVVEQIKAGQSVNAGYIVKLSRGVENLLFKYFAVQDNWMQRAVQNLVDSELSLDEDLLKHVEKRRNNFAEALQANGDNVEICAEAYNAFHMALAHVEQTQKSRVFKRLDDLRAEHKLEKEQAAAKKQARFDRRQARKASGNPTPEVVIPAEQLAGIANISL